MPNPTDYEVNIYAADSSNPTVTFSDSNRANLGLCFSGGGSRALTCAWGQMQGLRQCRVGNETLLDRVRYLSSVSGGTWASVLYTYLPDSFSDDNFFGPNAPPEKLTLNSAPSGGMNVSQMANDALGVVPQNFKNLYKLSPENIIAKFLLNVKLLRLPISESLQWLWMYIVANNVLAPFGLYSYRYLESEHGDTPWNYQANKSFSLSSDYASNHIFNLSPSPPSDEYFHFVHADKDGHPDRPMLIVNTNWIAEKIEDTLIQIPVQSTPVSTGSLGINPHNKEQIVGGGSVESFGYTSGLQAQVNEEVVRAEFHRKYTLADIASCSSAFYAATLAELLDDVFESFDVGNWEKHLKSLAGEKTNSKIAHEVYQQALEQKAKVDLESLEGTLRELIPQYNHWPVAAASEGEAANQLVEFTDGGNLDNTGLLGMLAQTDVDSIVVFLNTSVPLEVKNGVIIAAAQASPLFGIAYSDTKFTPPYEFKPYEGNVNPFSLKIDSEGFIKVFDNSNHEFDALRTGLYEANGSGQQSGIAFFKQNLTVVENPLVGIKARSKPVTVLWVQNARVNDWQNRIVDEALKVAIRKGQEAQEGEFAGFPTYSTFTKIHQTAAETNALAQMWQWCVSNEDSELHEEIMSLFAEAS